MSNWGQAGRTDDKEPERLSEEACEAIKGLEVVKAGDRNTVFNVYRSGQFLGQVTTRFGTQLFRQKPSDEWLFAVSQWNLKDPFHGHALFALLEEEVLSSVELQDK